ncbi:MAG: glucose-1-phosphate thymidylyltransferase [Solirubrobacteraceae bacterium]|nr:glucose-1-phosphate thymidylyltransferase [Solirubrobacteraceae bacterium]
MSQPQSKLKGLILSGGKGTRLRPITYTSAKQLVPVANTPVLFFGIRSMVEAGITEIGIIIAPETGGEIREAVGDGSQFGAQVTFIEQDSPAGLAHAVLTAEPFLGDDPFVMYLGDNLLQGGITGLVDRFKEDAPDALILLTEVDDPQSFGIVELDDAGQVARLVEKPKEPKSNLALVGVYLFTAQIHAAARAIEPSPRGELEITDAIQHLVNTGQTVLSEVVEGWWKDTGKLADMLEANRLVLDTIHGGNHGTLIESEVEGRVVIAEGAVLERAVVRGPAVIGAGARVVDAYIGPYTAIGAGCLVDHAEIEHSILLDGSSVSHMDTRIEGSLIGRDAKVERGPKMPKAIRLLIGDSSHVRLP